MTLAWILWEQTALAVFACFVYFRLCRRFARAELEYMRELAAIEHRLEQLLPAPPLKSVPAPRPPIDMRAPDAVPLPVAVARPRRER